DALQEVVPLLGREGGVLRRVDANGNDDALEDHSCALDEVEVAERRRIEAAGVDGQPRAHCAAPLFSLFGFGGVALAGGGGAGAGGCALGGVALAGGGGAEGGGSAVRDC